MRRFVYIASLFLALLWILVLFGGQLFASHPMFVYEYATLAVFGTVNLVLFAGFVILPFLGIAWSRSIAPFCGVMVLVWLYIIYLYVSQAIAGYEVEFVIGFYAILPLMIVHVFTYCGLIGVIWNQERLVP